VCCSFPCRRNKALVRELGTPEPESSDLYYPTQYSQPFFVQVQACFWKQWLTYWRSPSYNMARFLFAIIAAFLFGTIFWNLGKQTYVPFTLCFTYHISKCVMHCQTGHFLNQKKLIRSMSLQVKCSFASECDGVNIWCNFVHWGEQCLWRSTCCGHRADNFLQGESGRDVLCISLRHSPGKPLFFLNQSCATS
jgi:hypothetical protein